MLSQIKAHSRSIYGLAYSHTGNWLVSGGLDAQVFIWDASLASRTFGTCLYDLKVRMNCKGAQISRTQGLEQRVTWGLYREQEQEGTLLEFFAARGASLDAEQNRILTEVQKLHAE